ncbi:MAG: hypothetical protein ACRDOK_12780 [Streptosporangiaceae bacterium]
MDKLASPPLVPSSMNAGNTTSDDPQLAMTAPGTRSVLPVPEQTDVLPQPESIRQDRTVLVAADGGKASAAPESSPYRTDGGTYEQGPQGRWKQL